MTSPTADKAALHAAIDPGARPSRSGALSACLSFGWRGMLKIRHVPEQLVDVTIGPILLLVMFTYLFGGAVAGSPGDYLQFLLPGILVQAVLFTAVQSGVSLHTDASKGVVDRFRTLPIWQAAPLVGPLIADVVRYAVTAVMVLGVGILLGFDAQGGPVGLLAGASLVVGFAFALSWVFTTLGLVLRSLSAVQGISMTASFVVVFVSNVFVDPETLPSILEVVVRVNPISHLVTAVRGLLAGDTSIGDIALVVGEGSVLTAVFATLTARLYARI